SICTAVMEVQEDAILLALSGSLWVETAKDLGMRVGREIFADRAVNDDGTLVSRRISGSVIHDTEEVVDRSLRMVTEGKVISVSGSLVEVEADSICLHGDTPGAVDMAKSLKSAFEREGIEILPLAKLV
ncbi:MAG: LamB/YcsF family protein, partial [Chloroflexota bacterium]|nr:LamB/YcsF family protein [Chloroflexota bacterium]